MNFGTLGTGFGGLGRGGATGYTFVNAEAAAVSAAMAAAGADPSAARDALIDTLVGAWKTAGTWAKRDNIQIYAAHASAAALINWKNPGTGNATLVNSPTFTTDRGIATDGLTQEIDTGFNPSTFGGSFTQNSANFSIWSRSSSVYTGATAGWFDGSDGIAIQSKNGTGNALWRINQASATTSSSTTNGVGYFSANRDGAGSHTLYYNGSSIGTGTNASTALNNSTLRVGRLTASSYQAFDCSAMLAGGSLSGTEVADEYAALLTFMQAIGAG